MERFQRNMKRVVQETGNSKRIFFAEILISVFILMGCGIQETDQAEDKPHMFTDETAELLMEQAEEAACIIGNAFDGLGEIFAFKPENIIEELSQDVGKYYSLGEYASEEKIREYISTWFSEETFAYLKSMCGIMHGVYQGEDGTYMLLYDVSQPMDIYKLDDFSSVTIKEYTDTECKVSVTFVNTTTGGMGDTPIYSEGTMVLRREGDRWVITEISEPNYDEYYEQWGDKVN